MHTDIDVMARCYGDDSSFCEHELFAGTHIAASVQGGSILPSQYRFLASKQTSSPREDEALFRRNCGNCGEKGPKLRTGILIP